VTATLPSPPRRCWSPLTSPLEPLAEEGIPCIYCRGGFAEPEQDGDVVYFACPECGGEFGHRKAARGLFCAAGLPVPAPEPGPPVIATVIRRRPE
jgi:hypothetical protein